MAIKSENTLINTLMYVCDSWGWLLTCAASVSTSFLFLTSSACWHVSPRQQPRLFSELKGLSAFFGKRSRWTGTKRSSVSLSVFVCVFKKDCGCRATLKKALMDPARSFSLPGYLLGDFYFCKERLLLTSLSLFSTLLDASHFKIENISSLVSPLVWRVCAPSDWTSRWSKWSQFGRKSQGR